MDFETMDMNNDAQHWTLKGAHPVEALRTQGFALLSAAEFSATVAVSIADLDPLRPAWQALPPDKYLLDGGAYRYRRHASYVMDVATDELTLVPHRAHWQPTSYNALHGGIERWFEPISPATDSQPAWQSVLTGVGKVFAQAEGMVDRWFIEAHQFRIDTANGIGRPTPEGAHRDGVDFVAVILVDRTQVRGGETRVFDAAGPYGIRFVLQEPWTALLLNDARVIHETTPLQPAEGPGWRDTLVLTYRRHGFQSAS